VQSRPSSARVGRRSDAARRSTGHVAPLIGLIVALLACLQAEPAMGGSGSFWANDIGDQAPTDPNSTDIMAFIEADSSTNYVVLSGTTQNGRWGSPVYLAADGDPTYSVINTCQSHQPPEFASMRVPIGAQPDPTTDASMVVIDMGKGLEYGLWHTVYDPVADKWSACGGSVYYLASNELAGSLKESDERRNYGHRGIPPDILAVTWQEIQSGSIDHMLRIAVNTTKCKHVFPMSGDECGSTSQWAPPEGAVIRIKQSVDLGSLGLSGPGLVIARALQHYGAVIGDQTGGPVEIKVENTVAEGRGWLWKGVLSSAALSKIPLSSFEVVKLGYGA
jgi:hypothetical protein